MAVDRVEDATVDIAIVGAGFAGMYMLHRARGMGLRAVVFETGDGVGGTWHWNRYPGARCDVESMEYSYQFDEELQQDWSWSERFAAQPEILRYANHVADRFDLKRDIRFETKVTAAHFDDAAELWRVSTDKGDTVAATHLVMATGCLSSANVPHFEGMEEFGGDWYHTGRWPKDGVDFTGKRVAVIGTGSSAIQSIPVIARQAQHLTVFQRTPNYAVPAHNHPVDPEREAWFKANYSELREKAKQGRSGQLYSVRDVTWGSEPLETAKAEFARRWDLGGFSYLGAYIDLLVNKEGNDVAAEFVRDKIRETVKDPKTAELLCPTSVIGCKRLCVDTGYFETYNRDNVALVDISKAPIERLTERGLITGGREYDFDAIVFATGFDAMTGSLNRIDIRGRGGLPLVEKWEAGPRTYLGLTTVGFPNLFLITGPGSPSVLTNMLPTIEQHVDYVSDIIDHLRAHGQNTIEPEQDAEDAWVDHVNQIAGGTLYPSCNSWYLGANVPGKPRVFMPYPGFPAYVKKCQEIAASGYAGFRKG
ncbi:flavin-containing monooxygenase [Thalassobaculum litoreum]|uniref:Cyclohexanone monooxygenase n=1 Tax=Thalassobaculum litoreum DSM 18839 TaxID=1123362 RepID=A0A8G2BFR5_9PROT|nr:NAD(P)/FAD-dependent oxidoreductase [Thalassobaculum litoreum]SDF42237.1 cyclohexanone monooxygenase [Thalassobaculum litoreum DSM 18839]